MYLNVFFLLHGAKTSVLINKAETSIVLNANQNDG